MGYQTVRHLDPDLVPSDPGRTVAPDRDCPVEAAVAVISGRWATLVIRELLHGPLTYTALRDALPTLSGKVLGERLTLLQSQGIVERAVARGFPVTVTYRLTSTGESLRPLMMELYRTGESILAGRDAATDQV